MTAKSRSRKRKAAGARQFKVAGDEEGTFEFWRSRCCSRCRCGGAKARSGPLKSQLRASTPKCDLHGAVDFSACRQWFDSDMARGRMSWYCGYHCIQIFPKAENAGWREGGVQGAIGRIHAMLALYCSHHNMQPYRIHCTMPQHHQHHLIITITITIPIPIIITIITTTIIISLTIIIIISIISVSTTTISAIITIIISIVITIIILILLIIIMF